MKKREEFRKFSILVQSDTTVEENFKSMMEKIKKKF